MAPARAFYSWTLVLLCSTHAFSNVDGEGLRQPPVFGPVSGSPEEPEPPEATEAPGLALTEIEEEACREENEMEEEKLEDEEAEYEAGEEEMEDLQSPVVTCDFEDMRTCNKMWANAPGDNFDWKRATRTPSWGTGPSKAASGSYFNYIETSCPRRNGHKAYFRSKTVSLSSGASLKFKYHMHGKTIGELKVVAVPTGSTVVSGNTVFRVIGKQGNSWLSADVPLSGYAGKDVKLFVGIRGSSWSGDIAIDDITLDKGTPTTQAPTTQAPTTAAPTTMPPWNPPISGPSPGPSPAPSPGLHQKVARIENKMNEILRLVNQLVNQPLN